VQRDIGDVRIDLGGCYARITQQAPHNSDVYAVFDQQGCSTVPKLMRREVWSKVLGGRSLQRLPESR